MFDENPEQEAIHKKIVSEVLPRLADKLKREGVVSAHDQNPFTIRLSKDWPTITIIPDLVLHLPNNKKVLVEMANPKDPKRFVGEIIYPQLPGYYKQIAAAIVFVLDSRKGKAHIRSAVQRIVLAQFLNKQIPSIVASWPKDEDVAYRNLKSLLTRKVDWLFPGSLEP